MSRSTPENLTADDRRYQGKRPLIGITMGEPGGIGAEVVVKALADPAVRRLGRFIIYGLAENLEYAADLAEVNPYWFRLPHELVTRIESGTVVADFDDFSVFGPAIRHPTAQGGEASMRFLNAAIKGARDGFLEGIVTAPICKESWAMAGYKFPGHTEKLAHAFHADRVTMMFVTEKLRVALASIHEPLFDLRNSFTIGRVFQPVDLMGEALVNWFGIENPRIGVCGLNPHAGENGLFGDEEKRIIEPALVMAREVGWDVAGPYPADTLFWRTVQGHFDGVVAMYHDQGLIPVKLLAFDSACQTTLGLPVIRTSVDHGTAFDIANRNIANPESMKSAIRLACELAIHNRSRPATPTHRPPLDVPGETLGTVSDE
ncbi:MAG TPA: 4-hydroxythreonine-4-phosphate dehydrogenase PdxA [Phycisphaerae bacterium]|nr:4-hydroxythreonine-4-phosphate dehydrogenase PdxA [Phycisphaerae bacterium]HRY67239.1 4-hydroxythreonine-4-phosphate dehydrogenase PdxA [Phycisphaerae bacterium]HSA26391.1 4-hydroxythreonine-4-phosphate dehydrogenase PdxA [Phycisphaerae bacterium]